MREKARGRERDMSKDGGRRGMGSVRRSGAKSIVTVICVLLILMVVASFGGGEKETMGENGANGNAVSGKPAEGLGYQSISMEEAAELLETLEQEGADYVLLDVRTEAEFADGHIPGAVCLPNEEIAADIPAEEQDGLKAVLPDLSQKVLVYCRSGNRSKQAATKLANLGYTDIIECGGILDWQGSVEA